jgi:hypothetical protein
LQGVLANIVDSAHAPTADIARTLQDALDSSRLTYGKTVVPIYGASGGGGTLGKNITFTPFKLGTGPK